MLLACSVFLAFAASPDDGYYLLSLTTTRDVSVTVQYYYQRAVACTNVSPQQLAARQEGASASAPLHQPASAAIAPLCTEFQGPAPELGALYTQAFVETTHAALGLVSTALALALLMCLAVSCALCSGLLSGGGERPGGVARLQGTLRALDPEVRRRSMPGRDDVWMHAEEALTFFMRVQDPSFEPRLLWVGYPRSLQLLLGAACLFTSLSVVAVAGGATRLVVREPLWSWWSGLGRASSSHPLLSLPFPCRRAPVFQSLLGRRRAALHSGRHLHWQQPALRQP
jgi:hypothetical protein